MSTSKLLSICVTVVAGWVALAPSAYAFGSSNIIVTLRSVDEGGDPLMDPADNPAPFTNNEAVLCYEATLLKTRPDRVIGTGIDCLDTTTANTIEIPDAANLGLPGVVTLERTTYLTFFRRGTIVARGLTSVSYAPGIFASGFTHSVADVPGGDSTTALIPELSTGKFVGRTGAARLAGAVNMSRFPEMLRFNCIFVVDFDPYYYND